MENIVSSGVLAVSSTIMILHFLACSASSFQDIPQNRGEGRILDIVGRLYRDPIINFAQSRDDLCSCFHVLNVNGHNFLENLDDQVLARDSFQFLEKFVQSRESIALQMLAT